MYNCFTVQTWTDFSYDVCVQAPAAEAPAVEQQVREVPAAHAWQSCQAGTRPLLHLEELFTDDL